MFARVGEDALGQFGREVRMNRHLPFQDCMALRMCIPMRMAMPLRMGSLRRRHLSHDLSRQRSLVRLLDLKIVAIGNGAAGYHAWQLS